MAATLSICTPTHAGRAGTLAYGIEALLSQSAGPLRSRVELCISDNASNDGTEELVRSLSAHSPVPIRYRRNPVDLGPGRNIVQSVEMARGDYCWLVSSDDALADGALARMLELLDEHSSLGGVSTTCEVFDHAMGRRMPPPQPPDRSPPGDSPRVIEGLTAIVAELGSAFIGMSTQVVHREAWLQAVRAQERSSLVDGLLPHIVFLVGAAYSRPRWLWCPEPLVKWRAAGGIYGGIDNYMARILDDLARSLLAYVGPRDPGYRRAITGFVRVTYSPHALRTMAALPTHTVRGRYRLIRVLLLRLYWLPDLWCAMLPSVLLPGLAVRAVRKARRVAATVAGTH